MGKAQDIIRVAVSVHKSDEQIMQWLARQHSVSNSVRLVIKDYISRYGMIDVACQPFKIDTTSDMVIQEPVPVESRITQQPFVPPPVQQMPQTPVSQTTIQQAPVQQTTTQQVPVQQTQQKSFVANESSDRAADMLADMLK